MSVTGASTPSRSSAPSYSQSLRRAMDLLLPCDLLPALWLEGQRFPPRILALLALLIGYDRSATARERFAAARQGLIGMYPSRKRPGKSYNHFMDALVRYSQESLPQLQEHLRRQMQQILRRQWMRYGWVILAADGSKINLPDSKANQAAYGSAGTSKTAPQLLLVMVYHLLGGVPWAWKIGGGKSGERELLAEMLDLLPEHTLLVCDAGLISYELCRTLLEKKVDFVLRVGANVHLLTKLGYARREGQGTVYLWPDKLRRQVQAELKAGKEPSVPPLVLRLIVLERREKGRVQRMYLLTNVERKRLGKGRARRIYGLRWQVELGYRALKQTMDKRKLCSRTPERAVVELQWSVMGLWLLGLLSLRQLGRGLAWSPAAALRIVREALRRPEAKSRGGGVLGQLREAAKDAYRRHGGKEARRRRDKKKQRPPGRPKARKARRSEVRLAQRVRSYRPAA